VSTDRCEVLCLDLARAEDLRGARLDDNAALVVSGRAAALADPTRLVIAAALRDGSELCVCDVAWIVERSQTLVSHHLRLLRSQGLAKSRKQGKMVMYALTEQGRATLDAFFPAAVAVVP
jgi:DNA-binding transcriptional ArsR family regulator